MNLRWIGLLVVGVLAACGGTDAADGAASGPTTTRPAVTAATGAATTNSPTTTAPGTTMTVAPTSTSAATTTTLSPTRALLLTPADAPGWRSGNPITPRCEQVAARAGSRGSAPGFEAGVFVRVDNANRLAVVHLARFTDAERLTLALTDTVGPNRRVLDPAGMCANELSRDVMLSSRTPVGTDIVTVPLDLPLPDQLSAGRFEQVSPDGVVTLVREVVWLQPAADLVVIVGVESAAGDEAAVQQLAHAQLAKLRAAGAIG